MLPLLINYFRAALRDRTRWRGPHQIITGQCHQAAIAINSTFISAYCLYQTPRLVSKPHVYFPSGTKMALCERCGRLDIHRLPPTFEPRTEDFPLATLRQVFEGAASACPFCRVLMSQFYNFSGHEDYITDAGPVEEHANTLCRLRRRVFEWERPAGRVTATKFGGIELRGPGRLVFDIPLYAERG